MRMPRIRLPITGRRRWRAIAAISALSLVGGVMAIAAPAQAAVNGCSVTYAKSAEWPGGFTAAVTIKNTGTENWNGWDLTFTFPDSSQRVSQGWSATWSQSGSSVTAQSMSWNGNVSAGNSVQIGFNGSWSGSDPSPSDFAINGFSCGGASNNHAPSAAITSPTANQHFTAPANITIQVDASDPDSGDSISKVEFYHDGLLLGTVNSAPWTYIWSAVPVGDYSLQIQAYDTHGASVLSAPVPITVDANTQPSILITDTSLTIPAGQSDTFGVRLSDPPDGSVTVSVTGDNTGDQDLTASPTSLTFTSSNYDTAQTVTVSDDAGDTSNGSREFTLSAAGYQSVSMTAFAQNQGGGGNSVYTQRFMTQYNKLHASTSGYFSPEGIPYHSVETLMVEAPDYGHETTSEAFSFWLWLEATYGQVTGEWQPFNDAWATMEKYIIPSHDEQPTNAGYNPSSPATYAPEEPEPSDYPVAQQTNAPVGQDPIANELEQAYGTPDIYGMHWLLDVDDIYGFGNCEDGSDGPSYINTYQRGSQESVWETVPQPACDMLKYGGPNGYLDLFQTSSSYAAQWKYTDAPDADARAIEAAYWAYTWASAQGKEDQVAATVAKAGKMGDYLRYSMFDKYFKKIGNCIGISSCANGSGKSSMDYLLGWYYAWGGAKGSGSWAWRIGDGAAHFGYQNPMAAWALVNVAAMQPKSATGVQDWTTSLQRQLEFYQWLQSDEGAFAGGATNSWNNNYGTPPSGDPTFYGMFYDWEPVYHDPPSNNWWGMQAWSVERLAEYYYTTGDATAKSMLDKWVDWAMANTTVDPDTGDFSVPDTLNWSGQPETWDPDNPQPNTNLHVTIVKSGTDVGTTASYIKLLSYYAAKSGDTAAKTMAKNLLDALWKHTDDIGVGIPETRTDYNRFTQVWNSSSQQGLYIPDNWTGTMPNGDEIKSGDTFLDIRSWYKNDPDWQKVQDYLDGGPAPVFTYHRFWAQSDIAMANADYGMLFPNG